MTACARFLGRDVSTCTRGTEGCVCRREDDYAARVRALEEEGLTTSDAQGVVDAEDLRAGRARG